MNLFFAAFLAGFLTVLAPCVFTLLPVVLGGSVTEKSFVRPMVIISSLGVSVFLFSLLLKGSSLLIDIPNSFWSLFSGIILICFGLIMVFPALWDSISFRLKLYKSENLLIKSGEKDNWFGAVLIGASLGPVFTTCSPTYALILAIILPASLWTGVLSLFFYVLGLALVLSLVALGGQKFVKKMNFLVNPDGYFKKILGGVIVLTGVLVLTGYDKVLESYILDLGYNGPILIEERISEYFGL